MGVLDPPPFQVVKSSTGTGKSHLALGPAISLAKQGYKVPYLTPTIALADELAQRVRPGISVRVWRGRDLPDPQRPGQTMCQELDLVRRAQSVYADPNDVVCPICPHLASCSYHAQRGASASIWFGASSLLWHPIPAVMKDAKLLVIDEMFALDGLKGIDGAPIVIQILIVILLILSSMLAAQFAVTRFSLSPWEGRTLEDE